MVKDDINEKKNPILFGIMGFKQNHNKIIIITSTLFLYFGPILKAQMRNVCCEPPKWDWNKKVRKCYIGVECVTFQFHADKFHTFSHTLYIASLVHCIIRLYCMTKIFDCVCHIKCLQNNMWIALITMCHLYHLGYL